MIINSLIDTSKFGNCSRCESTNTQVRKRGKVLLCLSCCRQDDVKSQTKRKEEKNKVRSLGNNQKDSGNTPLAERMSLIQDIDWYYSRYRRIKDSDQYLMITCYICGRVMQWSMSQLMHYISRSCIQLRWDERNTKCGCSKCNVFENGNLTEYAKKLNEEQQGLPELLLELSREVYKPSLDELRGILAEMKQKLKVIENAKIKK